MSEDRYDFWAEMSEDRYDFCYFCDKVIRDGDPCYDPWKDEVILCPICYDKFYKLIKKEPNHKNKNMNM